MFVYFVLNFDLKQETHFIIVLPTNIRHE
jgi:hypothetical protein